MSRSCEVCANHDSQPVQGKVRRLLIEQRIVSLCDAHAAHFRLSGSSTLDALQEMFREEAGRRSLISRRAPLDRRVFPARPEGRRHNDGRRNTD
jgi:hypothetical protein